ncbi:peptide ABC transporter substrate-binding protein [Carnobacterium divergens]|uniref:peptide ABC transporter substrate-binding protein n=1 Tax=Carnobacterium divergens TaxID=2748 RepID=UPI00107160C8|nr:peptide ABC transporter substrate-binding protein [Carnobacterium divergens]TFJ45075.1 peptide ABC transporter substrate-binding protein [Carnobacterium divergens]TFJ52144.1 peptide ABC transporter substrate-binding protein [Carnobacterium divergens]TFJ57721.1 peptide ABC transporter substrate-binding protein [Carnobacterium divergens]TFJ65736.1 peptide ABC transporter substrate-binding protein [Carnobacterium divergens]TFJ74041.1 peptide ABC transporter substrate-binding protein [Carnobact
MNVKKLGMVSSTVLVMTILVACGGNQKEEVSNQSTKQVKKETLAKKQELTIIETAEIPSMDTALNVDGVSSVVMNNVFEGLYRATKDGEVELGMASAEPTISKDGLTYTFKLKKEAKWSNGDLVTANDFVYAWKKTVDPASGAAFAYLFEGVLANAIEIQKGEKSIDELGVKALDDQTLEIQLVANVPYFKGLLTTPTFFPQNQKYVAEKGNRYSTTSESMIYNGPFTLTKWDGTGLTWVYQKNQMYWDKQTVKLDTINVDVVKENSARINLFDSDATDITTIDGDYLANYQEDPNLKSIPESSVFYFQFNQEKAGNKTPLANQNIRKALALSYDKKAYVDTVLQNDSIVANGLIPAGLVKSPDGKIDFRKSSGDLQTFNKKEAQAAWKKGLKELGVETLTIELLSGDTDSAKKSSEFMQGQWESNLTGLKVSLKNVPFKVRLELDSKQDYDIQLSGWSADYSDPMAYLDIFQTGKSYNTTSYSNKEYDALVDAIGSTDLAQLDKRWSDMEEAEKILLDDYNIAPIYQRSRAVLEKSYVKGIVSHLVGANYSYKWAYVTEK